MVDRRRKEEPTPRTDAETARKFREARPSSGIERYRAQLAIDQDDLGDGLVRQPELYDHVGQGLALAISELDQAKLDLAIMEAEEGQKARSELTSVDDKGKEKKPTEGDVAECVILAPRVKQARKRIIDAKAEVDTWAALKESYQQRSYMLRECVSIHLARMGASQSMMRRENPAQAYADDVHDRAGKLREERGYRSKRGA